MTASLPPGNREPSNADILATLRELSDTVNARHQQLADQGSTFHTMLKHQGDQIGVLTKKHADLEKELKLVDSRARTALGSQAELEGSLMREVGNLASNDKKQNHEMAAIKDETRKQSIQLAEIMSWKKAAALLVVGAPGIWEAIQWLLVHK